MNIKLLQPDDFININKNLKRSYHDNYLVMYSSLWKGMCSDPTWWSIPPDDHLAHRGDGVFDFFKCVEGRAYCLDEHLKRLEFSAKAVGISLPADYENIMEILKTVLQEGGDKNAQARITISRGPGGFTSNPYECPESQLYVISFKPHLYSQKLYDEGVSIVSTSFVGKDVLPNVKSCNYLHNVLVKKAAVDAGVDYAVCFDSNGYLTESATENLSIITKDGEFLAPKWDGILQGVTLTRIMDKAKDLVKKGLLKEVKNTNITEEQAKNAAEVIISSTTMDLFSVVKWDDKIIADGRPGPIAKELLQAIRQEQLSDNPFTTDMWK